MKLPIILATRNNHKIKELKDLLKFLPINILTYQDFSISFSITETEPTLEGNALKKCRTVYRLLSDQFSEFVVVSDDTGLEIAALNGAPGVFSARYASKEIDRSSKTSDEENVKKVLREMNYEKKRLAQFRTFIGISGNIYTQDIDGYFETYAEGTVKGTITQERRGENGFGYDSIFSPIAYSSKTFAELSMKEKNTISHRGIALREVSKYLTIISSWKN